MLERLRQRYEEFLQWMRTPPHNLSGRHRTLRWWFDLARHCGGELRRDRAATMAAALTYHTLFSLMPTLVLSLVIMHSFVGPDQMTSFREGVVNWILQPLQQEETLLPNFAQPREVEGQGAERRAEFEDVRKSLGQQVEAVLDRLETVDFRSVGIVGVLLFIWAATGLLATIESSFNHIYKAGPSRPPYRRVPIYYTTITLGPLLIFGGQILQQRILDSIVALNLGSTLLAVVAVLTPLVSTGLVLLFLYVLLPNTSVSWTAALMGSGVAAVLWLAGAQAFSLYVRRAAISTLYGALGLLPLFLLWLWVTWLIVLFGLELAYALQAMKEGRFAWRSYYEGDQIVIDRTLVLPLATRIAQAFQKGEVAKVDTLTRQLRLPPAAVLRLLRALQSAGLVREVDEGGRGYVLARPADTIQADEVLSAGRSIMPAAGARSEDASWGIVNELYQELQKSVNEISLAELAQGEAVEPA